VLQVLEAVATHQPIGLGGLARLLAADKNAIQRALVTLAEAGWIAPAAGPVKEWELTARIHAVANCGQGGNDLRLRARSELEALREVSGETTLLTLPDAGRFIVADVFESRQVLRTAPAVGTVVLPQRSATGYALLPYMPARARAAMLGQEPDVDLRARFAETLLQGYAVAVNAPVEGITVVAAPIFDTGGGPAGAICIVAPTDRATPARCAEFGELAVQAAARLSRGRPAAMFQPEAA